jgi:hypothetical protein
MGLLYLHQFLLQGEVLIYFTTNNLIDIVRKELLDGLFYQIFFNVWYEKLFFLLCILHEYTFTLAIFFSILAFSQEKKNSLFHEYKYLVVW